jgi:hypothetical protein
VKPLDPEVEKSRWRLALSLPAIVVAVTPFFAFAVALRNRWGYGPRLTEFLLAAKYVNAVCIGLLLVEAALIRSYTPAHKRLAILALVLAGIGAVLHFRLYSLK